jgi:peptide/nickel transport system substrate-binding protein
VRSRWLLLLALVAGIAVMAVLWYTASRSSEATRPQSGGTYVEGVAGAPSRINPVFSSFNATDSDLTSLIFSGLTRLGLGGEVLPDLAESWEVSADGLTYTFHLRSGVSWHDGEPFTADDVIFTIETLQDPDYRGEPSLADLFRSLSAVKVDDLTVEVTLAQPFAPFLAYASIGVLPSHLLSGLSAGELYNDPFNQHPVGTGPFRLTDLNSERAVLESYSAYHLGEPYLRRLELRFYADESRLLLALRQGELQGAFFRSPLSTGDRLYVENEQQWQVLKPPSSAYSILYLNNDSPLFADKRVRQALAYATDRDDIIAVLLEDQAVRADSPIPAGTWAYYPALDRYRFDPAEAARLLDEAGWLLNPNGIREKDGQELRFDLVTNEESERIAVAEELVRSWSEVGVQASVHTQMATNLLRDTLMPRQFEAALYGFDSGLDPDPYPTWHSTQIGRGKGNLAGFVNAHADSVLEEARQESDPQRRAALYREFQEVFAQELPSLPLFQRTFTYVVDKRLQGVEVGVLFDSGSRFSLVRQWHLEGK